MNIYPNTYAHIYLLTPAPALSHTRANTPILTASRTPPTHPPTRSECVPSECSPSHGHHQRGFSLGCTCRRQRGSKRQSQLGADSRWQSVGHGSQHLWPARGWNNNRQAGFREGGAIRSVLHQGYVYVCVCEAVSVGMLVGVDVCLCDNRNEDVLFLRVCVGMNANVCIICVR